MVMPSPGRLGLDPGASWVRPFPHAVRQLRDEPVVETGVVMQVAFKGSRLGVEDAVEKVAEETSAHDC